jgi:[acyl-carrier-protein] S-malonyltransferase
VTVTDRVAAWVDGQPIGADEVEARLTELRARDRASGLPKDDTREGRQLRRWVAQVLVVERVCEHTAASFVRPASGTRGSSGHEPDAGAAPTRSEAAAAGSIVAAAWASSPAVSGVASLVTDDLTLSPAATAQAARILAGPAGEPVWSEAELLRSARMEAFARWLARATHERVRLADGFEHPGDSNQPDNLHEH